MQEAISSTQIILLTSILGVLVLLALILTRMSNQLARMMRHLSELDHRSGESSATDETEPRQESSSAYDTFLSEDPQRLALPKKERFRLYRIWRQEKGLNWTPPKSDSTPQG